MISRSGGRVPAGVSGQAGRGTVGTDAPTTQKRRRFRDAIVQDIDASHPNALSRLDRLDGVGERTMSELDRADFLDADVAERIALEADIVADRDGWADR